MLHSLHTPYSGFRNPWIFSGVNLNSVPPVTIPVLGNGAISSYGSHMTTPPLPQAVLGNMEGRVWGGLRICMVADTGRLSYPKHPRVPRVLQEFHLNAR